MSSFGVIGKTKEGGDDPFAGRDEAKMGRVFEDLMNEAEGITEDDPC